MITNFDENYTREIKHVQQGFQYRDTFLEAQQR